MRCNRHEQFEMGKLTEEAFRHHAESCPACRKSAEENERLMTAVRLMKEPVEAPGLWERIEADLMAENNRRAALEERTVRKPLIWLPVAAVFILAVGLIGLLILSGGNQSPGLSAGGLLADSALRKVERKESAYVKAIETLERRIHPKLTEIDLELSLLYRDRLEIIDDQIAQCREALAENPANAHIRRYMLTALMDKHKTLKELKKLPLVHKKTGGIDHV